MKTIDRNSLHYRFLRFMEIDEKNMGKTKCTYAVDLVTFPFLFVLLLTYSYISGFGTVAVASIVYDTITIKRTFEETQILGYIEYRSIDSLEPIERTRTITCHSQSCFERHNLNPFGYYSKKMSEIDHPIFDFYLWAILLGIIAWIIITIFIIYLMSVAYDKFDENCEKIQFA